MRQDEIERVHEASLRLLEDPGVRLEHDEIVARLRRAGAAPGAGPQDVRLPRPMVEEHLGRAPRTVELAGRDGSVATLAPDSEPVFWTTPALHLWTGSERRPLVSEDLAAVARLCDRLGNVQGVMGTAMADVPPPHRDFVGLRVIAENGRKHARALSFTPAGAEAMVEMKAVFPGNWFSMGFAAHGPLRWTHLALDVFLRSAGRGVPVTINGEPMAGVTGPVTLAGSVALGNAEILAGIVVNQMLEPGRPVVYNLGLAHTFDMRHATVVTGGPENALFAAASAAMGRFYGLPSASWVSTDSVHEDEQAGLEKMFGFHAHSASGVSLVWGMGQLESEMTVSLAQLVIDDEMVDYARFFRRGFAADEADLAVEPARAVGIAGSFLEAEHTLLHFREHLYEPRLLNRRKREDCRATLQERARERAEEILAEDQGPRMGADESAELRRIEDFFRRSLR